MRSRVKFALTAYLLAVLLYYKFFESVGNGHQFSQARCENNSLLKPRNSKIEVSIYRNGKR